jgi:hypothetical protein
MARCTKIDRQQWCIIVVTFQSACCIILIIQFDIAAAGAPKKIVKL